MTSERKLSIATLIFKITSIILIAISLYFIITAFMKFMAEHNKSYNKDNLDELYNDFKIILKENAKWGICLGTAYGLSILTYILDIIIISIASWKTQAFGKIILLLSLIIKPLWLFSWIGNIGIIAKKRS